MLVAWLQAFICDPLSESLNGEASGEVKADRIRSELELNWSRMTAPAILGKSASPRVPSKRALT